MSNTRKVSLSKKAQDRPTKKESRAETVTERPERIPLDGFRDILTVKGQDESYKYRFVKDVEAFVENAEGGIEMRPSQRIMAFQGAGWEFVNSDSVTVGSNHVYKTDNVGSIVRIPAGQNEFLYLMRIHKDWYDEDQANKEKRILDAEAAATQAGAAEGMYGDVSIGYDN